MRPLSPLETDEAAIALGVQAERARIFNGRVLAAALTSPLGFLLLAWLIYQSHGVSTALSWLAVMVAVEIAIIFVAKRFVALDTATGQSGPWLQTQITLQAIAGCVWSSAIWFTPELGGLLDYLAMLTILVGVMGYGIVTMCLFTSAAWGFFGSMFGMLMLHLLFRENELKNVISLGLVAQLVSQVTGAGGLRKMMLKDIDAFVRNKALVVLMSEAREQLEQAHAAVNTKNLQLQDLLAHDQLTGAYSRRYMLDQMERMLSLHQRHDHQVCLIMFDLDHFKQINDRYGHPVGDAALVTAVAAVKSQLRDGDMLGRVGGEEFLALLPMTDLGAATQLAQRLRLTLSEALVSAGNERIHLPASFGVADLEEREDVSQWLRRVDSALYQAKKTGRNKVVVAQAEPGQTQSGRITA